MRTKKPKIVWLHLKNYIINDKKKKKNCPVKVEVRSVRERTSLSSAPFTNAPIRLCLIYTPPPTSCIRLEPNVRCADKRSFTTFSGLMKDVAIFHTDLWSASDKLRSPNTLLAIFPLSGQLLVVEAPPAPSAGLPSQPTHCPTYLLSRKRKGYRQGCKRSTKMQNYLSTVLSRHPPVAVVPTLHGKMAATTAEWMTDQGGEAEAAAERGEGAGSANPAEGWGWGTGRSHKNLRFDREKCHKSGFEHTL